jgi:hypothetical protein
MSDRRYAEGTKVSTDRSVAEIQRWLRRYGATAFTYGWDEQSAALMFEMANRRILFRLPMPNPREREFTHTPTGKSRAPGAAEQVYEQAVRQRWRALALVIKAKLEAVAAGITTLEQEFLAHIQMPDGRTVGEHTAPAIAVAYESGQMSRMLPGGNPDRS